MILSTGRFFGERENVVSSSELRRWRWAVTGAFGIGGIAGSALGPRLPAVEADLGISTGTIGLLLAGMTVGAIGGLLSSTPVRHWLGGRRGIAAAALTVTGSMAVMGLALVLGWVPLLAAGLVVMGTGIGLLDVLINVEGSGVERSAGRSLMPGMHAAWSIGAAVGSGIGAACAALGVTPAAQLIGEAIVLAAASLVIATGIPAREHILPDADTLADPGTGAPRRDRAAAFRQWLRGWANARLLLIGLVMLGCELGEGSANSWLTLAAKNNHGQSAAIAALFFTAFAISEGGTRIFAGPVVDRLGRVRTTRITTAAGLVGVALFILGDSAWLVLVGVVLWGVGVSMGFPLGMSAAAETGPNPAAQLSVVASIGYFAGLAGPPVVGTLAESAGLLNALWLLAFLFLAAFTAAGSLRPGPSPAPHQTEHGQARQPS
jgi:MFS family permease